jgi:hypothetical protein
MNTATFNFRLLESNRTGRASYSGLRVSNTYVYFPRIIRDKLRKMGISYADVMYDVKNKAVAIRKSTTSLGKRVIRGDYISTQLAQKKHMPLGRYSLVGESKDMLTFVKD